MSPFSRNSSTLLLAHAILIASAIFLLSNLATHIRAHPTRLDSLETGPLPADNGTANILIANDGTPKILCAEYSAPNSSQPAADPSESPLRNRDQSHRADALQQFGGNRKTQRAVADGLAWLAAHQRPDGIWDRRAFDQLCPPSDRCSHTALTRSSKDCDVGVTALASLAFLGAGHTHQSGPYADRLGKSFSYLLAQQSPSGTFSRNSALQLYNDAIATLAIAELYVLTRDPILADPLQRAVAHLQRAQQPAGGWDYTDETSTGRVDNSITGWVLMALKSAKAAGFSPSLETSFRLLAHLDASTELDGRLWYANKGTGTIREGFDSDRQRRYGPAMTAVGLFARTAFDLRPDDPTALKQSALLLNDLPSLEKLRGADPTGLHNEYYWYYGTIALFNRGGPEWRTWNNSLRRTVLEYQDRPTRKNGDRRHAYGSWPAYGPNWGKWGRTGSRIYSTALNTLTLEVYYRYVPAFLSPQGLLGPAELRGEIARSGPLNHPAILRVIRRLHPDIAEPLFIDLLDSPNDSARLDAAIELTLLGSPIGRDALTPLRATVPADARPRIFAALENMPSPPAHLQYGPISQISRQAGMFLFDTNDQPLYYGQRVAINRNGNRIATAIVNRRFTAQRAAAAKLDHGPSRIRVSDTVTTLDDPPSEPPHE